MSSPSTPPLPATNSTGSGPAWQPLPGPCAASPRYAWCIALVAIGNLPLFLLSSGWWIYGVSLALVVAVHAAVTLINRMSRG